MMYNFITSLGWLVVWFVLLVIIFALIDASARRAITFYFHAKRQFFKALMEEGIDLPESKGMVQ